MEIISSRSNPKIKSACALQQRKQRAASASYLVEGIHQVGAAVEAGAMIERVFFAPDLLESTYAQDIIERASERGVPCYPTTEGVFTSLASRENPQGILAVVRQRREKLQDLNPEVFSWGVACVAPQDAGNVGTILRTIDAVGASGLILLEGGVDSYHPTAVRASMGAVFRHQVVQTSFEDFSQWAQGHSYQIYGTSARGNVETKQIIEYPRPLILLLGDERLGLTPEQVEICQVLVRLPMHGQVTSLNLAVAAGVMLYEMLEKMDKN